MPMTVRIARPDELDDVARLMLAAYEEYMPAPDADITPEYRKAFDNYRVDIGDVRSRLDAAELLVAEENGRLVGAVTYYPPNVTAEYPGDEEHEPWPVEWAAFRLLAVEPEQRGKGIGKVLTNEVIARAREAGAPFLGLHTTMLMEVAREMYKRMGWIRASKYDFYPLPDFCVEAYTLAL